MELYPRLLVLLSIAVYAVPLERVTAWVSTKNLHIHPNLAEPPSFLESQWGVPYVNAPGRSNPDGSLTFDFSASVDQGAPSTGNPSEGGGGSDSGQEITQPNEGSGSTEGGENTQPDGGSGSTEGGENTQPDEGSGSTEGGENTQPDGGSGSTEGGENTQPDGGSGSTEGGENTQPDEGSGSTEGGENTQPDGGSGTGEGNENTETNSDSCFAVLEGVDRLLSEVFLTLENVKSAEECQTTCLNSSSCSVAFFNVDESTCEHLRRLQISTSGQEANVVLPTCDSGCFLKNQTMGSGGTSLGTTPSAVLCQALCQGDPVCEKFTWLSTSGACTSHESDSDLSHAEGAVSGPRESCTPNSKQSDYAGSCVLQGYTGSRTSHLSYTRKDTTEQCHELCLTTPECKWFTHNVNDKFCYLKTERGYVEPSVESDFTGPKLCNSSCFRKDIEFAGSPILSTEDSADPYNCQYDCFDNKDCHFWTWNAGKCSLHGIVSALTGRHTAGAWSGGKGGCGSEQNYVDSSDKAGLGIVKYATASTDYYLTIESVESLEACADWCDNEERCLLYQYDAPDKKCQLSEWTGNVVTSSKPTFIGLKSASTSCFTLDTAFSGDVLEFRTLSSATAAICQAECSLEAECKAFVWNRGDKSCTFKKVHDPNGTASKGYVSGGKTGCYVKPPVERDYNYYAPEAHDGGCNHHGVEPNSTPYKKYKLEIPSLPLCLDECTNEYPRCSAFVFDSAFHTCSLYGNIGDGLKTGKQNSFLGPAMCDSRCFYKDLEFTGEAMDVRFDQSIGTPHECQLRCRNLSDCYAWTWDSGSQSCRFFTSTNSLVLRPAGNKWSGRWGFCKKVENPYFNGKTCNSLYFSIKNTIEREREDTYENIDSMGECMKKCREHGECNAVTYQERIRKCFMKREVRTFWYRDGGYGDHTAPRECRRDCHIGDLKFEGGYLVDNFKTPTEFMCQAACVYQRDKCTVWSYNIESWFCELRGSDPSELEVKRKDSGGEGWVSGHNHFCF